MFETDVRFLPARPGDWPEIAALLQAAGLPQAGAIEHLDQFIVARRAEVLIGVAGLEAYGDEGLLRSVVVAARERGSGLGRRLVADVIAAARERGLRGLTLLTETAPEFFPRLGFVPIARQAVPEVLRASAEFQGACPDSAVALRLDLTPSA